MGTIYRSLFFDVLETLFYRHISCFSLCWILGTFKNISYSRVCVCVCVYVRTCLFFIRRLCNPSDAENEISCAEAPARTVIFNCSVLNDAASVAEFLRNRKVPWLYLCPKTGYPDQRNVFSSGLPENCGILSWTGPLPIPSTSISIHHYNHLTVKPYLTYWIEITSFYKQQSVIISSVIRCIIQWKVCPRSHGVHMLRKAVSVTCFKKLA